MSALVLASRPRLTPEPGIAALELGHERIGRGPQAYRGGLRGERPTLERVVEDAWAQLAESGATHCPVCGGAMVRARSSSYGKCEACGSTLR